MSPMREKLKEKLLELEGFLFGCVCDQGHIQNSAKCMLCWHTDVAKDQNSSEEKLQSSCLDIERYMER